MAGEGNKIARGREFHCWSMSNNHSPFTSPFPLHMPAPEVPQLSEEYQAKTPDQ